MNFLKKLFSIPEPPKRVSFGSKLDDALDKAKKAQKRILHSDLPDDDRIEIADQILFLIDDLNELKTVHLLEMEEICQASHYKSLFM